MKKEKKYLIVLAIILILIIIVVVILGFVFKNKNNLIKQNDSTQEGWSQLEKQKTEEKIIRNGKMFLQTDLEKIKVNETFKVQILMNTQDSNIVVGSAYLVYNAENLELINIDTENSVLSMAVIKNNNPGELEIIRGEPGDTDFNDFDDGFNGENGILAVLEFKILKQKNIEIKFNQEKSNMILDNGKATEMNLEFGDLEIK